MIGHIDKAINYLKLYKLDGNSDYLNMAHREMKEEVDEIRKLSITNGIKSSERGERIG